MAVYVDLKSKYDDWITRFYDMFFKEECSREFLNKCLKFKIKNMSPSLYQYTKVKHAKDVLDDERMFLRPFSWLNDPFDGNFIHNVDLYLKEEMRVEVDESYKDKYYVACFSERNDIVPMWAFYGEDHNGICVEYNFNESDLFRDFCFPIRYVDNTDNDIIIKKILNDEDFSRRLDFELFLRGKVISP